MSPLTSPLLALAVAAFFWSGNFIAGRALRGLIDPLTLNFLRWSLALLIMTPFFWRSIRSSWPLLRRHWRLMLALGATGFAGFQTLVYVALQTTTATNAILVLSLAPITILLGSGLIGLERITTRQVVGAPISILGACVVITRGDPQGIIAQGFNSGDLWMVAAVALWTVYALLLRRRPAGLPPSVTLLASIVAALAAMIPLLPFASIPDASLATLPALLSIGYIVVGSSTVAFLLFSYGASQVGPARAGQFVHLMPVFGAFLAFVVLGEVPTAAQLVGAVLVLSGIAVVEGAALNPFSGTPADRPARV